MLRDDGDDLFVDERNGELVVGGESQLALRTIFMKFTSSSSWVSVFHPTGHLRIGEEALLGW